MQKPFYNRPVLAQFRHGRLRAPRFRSAANDGRRNLLHVQRLLLREEQLGGASMAKRRERRYSPSAGSDVKREMHRYKRGTARSGRGSRGGKVKSRKQAIAIGLSKARTKGKKVPKKRA
jgi:hypothetical protein